MILSRILSVIVKRCPMFVMILEWCYRITSPKSEAGNRDIPMLKDVKQALLIQKGYSTVNGFCVDRVDGYYGFVFHSKTGHVLNISAIDRTLYRICGQCNKNEIARAEREGRTPEPFPIISPHILRHTFCTRFCEQEKDIKVIQTIMGHSDIAITMNVYNDVNRERSEHSMQALEGKIRLC